MNDRTEDEETGPAGREPEPAAPAEGKAPGASVGERVTPSGAAEPDGAAEPEAEPEAAAAPGTASIPPAAPARSRVAAALAALALVVALMAAAATAWLAWAGRGETELALANREAIETAREQLAGTRSATEELRETLRERMSQLEDADEALAERTDELARRLGELTERHESVPDRLASVESTVASLAGISTGAREAWLLAETEYYLQVANAELQLAGNVERALHALRFADERLRQVGDPALTGVRRALADELLALESMETPDLAGVTLRLAGLAESVDSLPLAQDVRREGSEPVEPDPEAGGFDRALASVRAAFSDVISVRRVDEAVEPLLSPEAEYFLRANLSLRLQTARLALLRGEQEIVEQTLDDASEWLSEYYAVDSRPVQSALEALAEIRDAEWSVTPPDISRSLRLLREFRERRRVDQSEPAPAGDEPDQ